jgi:hypothetical protein
MNQGKTIYLEPVEDINMKKKIDPQIRLYSPKKNVVIRPNFKTYCT